MHDQTNPLLGTETETRAPLPSPRGCFELGLAVAPRPLTCAKSCVSLAPVDGWGEVPPLLFLADPIRSSAVCIRRREYAWHQRRMHNRVRGRQNMGAQRKAKEWSWEMQESAGQSGRGEAKATVVRIRILSHTHTSHFASCDLGFREGPFQTSQLGELLCYIPCHV